MLKEQNLNLKQCWNIRIYHLVTILGMNLGSKFSIFMICLGFIVLQEVQKGYCEEFLFFFDLKIQNW
jgi:hypothetical protein